MQGKLILIIASVDAESLVGTVTAVKVTLRVVTGGITETVIDPAGRTTFHTRRDLGKGGTQCYVQ